MKVKDKQESQKLRNTFIATFYYSRNSMLLMNKNSKMFYNKVLDCYTGMRELLENLDVYYLDYEYYLIVLNLIDLYIKNEEKKENYEYCELFLNVKKILKIGDEEDGEGEEEDSYYIHG